MDNLHLTRRALMITAGAASTAVVVPIAASPNSAITQAISRFRSCSEEARRYAWEIHEPIRERWQAELDAVPHHRTVNSYVNFGGERITLTTESQPTIIAAERALQDIDAGHLFRQPISEVNAEYIATVRELVPAARARTAARECISDASTMHASYEHCEALDAVSDEAYGAVLAAPVNSAADLCAKVEFIDEIGSWSSDDHAAILADVRRLASGKIRS